MTNTPSNDQVLDLYVDRLAEYARATLRRNGSSPGVEERNGIPNLIFKYTSLDGLIEAARDRLGADSPVLDANNVPVPQSVELYLHEALRYKIVVKYADRKTLVLTRYRWNNWMSVSNYRENITAALLDGQDTPIASARMYDSDEGTPTISHTANYQEMLPYLMFPTWIHEIKGNFSADLPRRRVTDYLKRLELLSRISDPSGRILMTLSTSDNWYTIEDGNEKPVVSLPLGVPFQTIRIEKKSRSLLKRLFD